MSDVTTSALLAVSRDTLAELKTLNQQLQITPAADKEQILRSAQKCSDLLSSSLDRLSFVADSLPTETQAERSDGNSGCRSLLLAAMRMN